MVVRRLIAAPKGAVWAVVAIALTTTANQLWRIPLVSGSPVWVTNMWTGFTNPWPDTLDEDTNGGGQNDAKVQLWQLVTGNINQEWRVNLLFY